MLKKLIVTLIGASGALGLAAESTPVNRLTVKKGFLVERLYSVPKDKFGSWVVLCKDDKGRLYAGDQYGAIYRFAPPAPGATLKDSDIQKVEAGLPFIEGHLIEHRFHVVVSRHQLQWVVSRWGRQDLKQADQQKTPRNSQTAPEQKTLILATLAFMTHTVPHWAPVMTCHDGWAGRANRLDDWFVRMTWSVPGALMLLIHSSDTSC